MYIQTTRIIFLAFQNMILATEEFPSLHAKKAYKPFKCMDLFFASGIFRGFLSKDHIGQRLKSDGQDKSLKKYGSQLAAYAVYELRGKIQTLHYGKVL